MFVVEESLVNYGFYITTLEAETMILKKALMENRAKTLKLEESIARYSLMLGSTKANISSVRTEMAEFEKRFGTEKSRANDGSKVTLS